MGATFAGTTSIVAAYGSIMPNITLPSKEGYLFDGYYTGTNGTGTAYYYPENYNAVKTWDRTSSSMTLYANWRVDPSVAIRQNIQASLNKISNYTDYHFSEDRIPDVQAGMVSAALQAAGDSGALLLQAIINTGRRLSCQLPSTTYYNSYLRTKEAVDNYFATQCTYIDSYYYGKMLGDIVISACGIGMTVAGITEMLGGATAAAAGTATAPTGIGAAVAVLGSATVVEGLATTTAGAAMAATGINNFSSDKAKYDAVKRNSSGSSGNWDFDKDPIYRGGNDFTVKNNEVKFNPDTGNVRTDRGVSLNTDPNAVSQFGGAYRIKSMPEGLKIIKQGQSLTHYEIVPAYEMPLEQFQALLNQITVVLS